MADAAFRKLEDRNARLQGREAPTDRDNRQQLQRRQEAQSKASSTRKLTKKLQAARDEDYIRTKQYSKATKLIEKIKKHTVLLTNSLPEEKGGGGEVGKLSAHYDKGMKTMGGFIKKFSESSPTNPKWNTLPDKRKRELLHFHNSLSSNGHEAINKFNTAKKHAEKFAIEAGNTSFRDKLDKGTQQKLDGWMQHLDGERHRAQMSVGTKSYGGRKTRRKKKKTKRKKKKTKRKKKKTKRKHKKRHHKTKRR